ncbi:hypothetical protein ACOSP7_016698 [Xanthoceras sorbifolium]
MQLARVEHTAGEGLFVKRGVQPNEVIQLDTPEVTPFSSDWTLGPIAMKFLERALTLVEDFLTKGLSRHIEEDQGGGSPPLPTLLHLHGKLCEELQTCNNELASKAALEKKLTEET